MSATAGAVEAFVAGLPWTDVDERRRSWWGWGWEDQALSDDEVTALGAVIGGRLGVGEPCVAPVPDLSTIELPKQGFTPPSALTGLFSADPHHRAGHTYGKSYRDIVRGLSGRLDHPPDLVAFPTEERHLIDILDFCSSAGIAAVPYGGASSVVGGVEYRGEGDHTGWISIDLTRMDRVREIDTVSRAARIQAGALGPVLEDQLRPHGYTLRHYPQSFEFSTLGGWLATRSGGHYATVYTHIDDLVESIRVVSPAGVSESRRLPGSGAGPSPDRLFLGSEGALGVITEAWMRIQARPTHKVAAAVHFRDHQNAVDATRAIAQSALFPTNCRLLDSGEAMLSAGITDGSHLLLLGFESADHPVTTSIERAVELCADHGGAVPDGIATSVANDEGPSRDGAVGAWRSAFLRAPYLRDGLARLGMVIETFETSCTWDRFPELHARTTESVTRALEEICGAGWVTCRFTHVYPDGPAPYFSVVAPGRPGSEVQMWDEVKAAASEAILANGGSITHHHAVGRDHDAWYRQQRPAPVGEALRAVKASLDPAGILNPGVLV